MPDWSLVDRSHVLAAIAEYDRLGSRDFLSRYRFGHSRAYTLWHAGQEYDSKAILGVAYLHATGRAATREEFRGGENGAAKVLLDLGFDVVVDEQALEQEERQAKKAGAKPAAARSATAPRKKTRSTAAQPAVRLCPNCHVAVPASGICDFCD